MIWGPKKISTAHSFGSQVSSLVGPEREQKRRGLTEAEQELKGLCCELMSYLEAFDRDWGYCTSGNRSQWQNFEHFPCDFNMHLGLRTMDLFKSDYIRSHPENKARFPT